MGEDMAPPVRDPFRQLIPMRKDGVDGWSQNNSPGRGYPQHSHPPPLMGVLGKPTSPRQRVCQTTLLDWWMGQ